MKKYFSSILLCCLSSELLAVSFSYYGGLSGGAIYNSGDFSKNMDVVVTSPVDGLVSENKFFFSGDTNKFTGGGQVQIGAGMSYEIFYLGLEALGQFSDGKLNQEDNTFVFIANNPFAPNSDFMSKNEFRVSDFEPALDLKPGIFLSENTLLYGRVGMAFNELKISQNNFYNLINSTAIAQSQFSHEKNLVALRLGLGAEHRVYESFHIFMDYTFTQYRDIDLTTSDQLSSQVANLSFEIGTFNQLQDLSKQAVMLGFNYYL